MAEAKPKSNESDPQPESLKVDPEFIRELLLSDRFHVPTFHHSGDFRSIRLDGTEYFLTSKQARVIEMLHEAHEQGTPEVGQHSILETLESGKRLRDVFKSNLDAWTNLIRKGTRKGTFRLNI